MAKLKIIRIVRSGKYQSRIETSDGHQLVFDHRDKEKPFVGMELDIEEAPSFKSELRPLRAGDKYPELLPVVTMV